MKRALAVAVVLGLTACAGAPKKSASGAKGDDGRVVAGASTSKKSPYPPAREDPSKRGNYTAGGLYAPGVDDTAPEGGIDVSRIPEPEVVAEPRSRYGNRETYEVLGKKYHVLDSAEGYVARGEASYYGTKFHGRRTSNMEVYDMYAFTAAHKSLPLPSFARVTNLDNGKSVVVRVNDRGPFHEGRIIDLSYAAAVKLGITRAGTGRVEVRALMPGEEAEPPRSSRIGAREANNPPPAAAPPTTPSAMDRLVAALPVAAAGAVELPPGVRIATGKPAAAGAVSSPPAAIHAEPVASLVDASVDATAAAAAATGSYGRAAATPVSPIPSATPAAGTDGVTLQVAAFSTRDNADRALAKLRDAGIDDVRVLDAHADGRPIWRLWVGPLDATAVPGLSARIAGLGFGRPQQVSE